VSDPFDPTTWDEAPGFIKLYLTPERAEQFVMVDAIDYGWLSQWTWQLHFNQKGKPYPARQYGSWRYNTRMRVYLHRAVLEQAVGPPPDDKRILADHINGDVFNARRENLRWVTRSENARNTYKYREQIASTVERYFGRFGA